MAPSLYYLKIRDNARTRKIRVLANSYDEALCASGIGSSKIVLSHQKLTGFTQKIEQSLIKKPQEYDLIKTFKKVCSLLRVNFTIDTALEYQIRSTRNIKLKYIIIQIVNDLRNGQSVYAAFGKQQGFFSQATLAMIKAGEAANKLSDTLNKIYETHTLINGIKKKVISALIYPFFLVISFLGVLVTTFFFLIPKLSDLFNVFDSKMPMFIQLTYGSSQFLSNHLLVVSLLSTVLFFYIFRKIKIRENSFMQKLILKIPTVGNLFIIRDVYISISYFTMMLKAGSNAHDALYLVSDIPFLKNIRTAYLHGFTEIHEGKSLSESMTSNEQALGSYTDEIIHTLDTGEKSGNLLNLLEEQVKILHEDLMASIENFQKTISPMLTVIMSAFSFFVILCALYPMMSLYDSLLNNLNM